MRGMHRKTHHKEVIFSIIKKHPNLCNAVYDGFFMSRICRFRLRDQRIYVKLIQDNDTVMGVDYVITTSVYMAQMGIGVPIMEYGYEAEYGYIVSLASPNTLDEVYFDHKEFYDSEVTNKIDQMHNLGVVHGDVNPENIGVTGNQVMLFDFDKAWPINQSNDHRVLKYLKDGYDWESTPEEFVLYERTQFVQD